MSQPKLEVELPQGITGAEETLDYIAVQYGDWVSANHVYFRNEDALRELLNRRQAKREELAKEEEEKKARRWVAYGTGGAGWYLRRGGEAWWSYAFYTSHPADNQRRAEAYAAQLNAEEGL